MAATKKNAKNSASHAKARADFQSWFRKELKKSVKQDREILKALD